MKLLSLLAALLLISVTGFSQSLVVEVPVQAVDLPDGIGRGMVYNSSDSSLVKGNFIDSNLFIVQFEAIEDAQYYIKLTAPGFVDTIIPFVAKPPVMRFDPVILSSDVLLDEINVVYEKPVFERTMNGLSVNVKGTTLEQLNTLFDILKASPRLSSPDDETIEIIGRGTPLILIDRQPIISNDELRAIPASEVDKIEIITNPSAKYRAQGSGNGVIEVYTNNFSLQGYRAHIRADAGMNTQKKFRSGTNIGLNLKKGKFSLNGNVGLHYREFYNFGSSNYATLDSSLYSNTGFELDGNSLWRHYMLKAGYEINEDQRISFGTGGHGSSGQNISDNAQDFYSQGVLSTQRLAHSENNNKWLTNRAFLNYTWDTDTIGSALEVNLNYTRRISDGENQFSTDFRDYQSQQEQVYNALAVRQDRPNIGEVRLNYEHYVDSNFFFEFGADVSALFNDKRFNRYIIENGQWVEDPAYTNSYNYQEQIAGAYAQVSKKWGKFGAQLGIRGEYTRLNGYSQSLSQQFMDSSYLLPFPDAGVLYEPNEKLAITAYYSSGIDRPSFQNFDPFVRVLDSLNVQFGNPYLRPSYEHNFGLEIDILYSYNLSLSYSRYEDFAGTLTFVDPTTFVTSSTPWNAKLNETYSLSLSIPINLDWLDGWNSIWLDYNIFEFTEIFQRAPYENITFGFSSYLIFKLPHNFTIMNRLWMNRWGNDTSTDNIMTHWGVRLTKEFDNPDINIFAEVNQLMPQQNRTETVNGNYLAYSQNQYQFTGFEIGVFFKFGRLTANTSIKESESGQSGRL
ncbi:MAG: TonB-dependent receptor [bacterium]|nr:TonB-dependent receptor [bacterium]